MKIRQIYKYPLMGWEDSEISIPMPEGSEILEAGFDPQGVLCIWVLVYPDDEQFLRTFRVYGTGFEVVGEVIHLSTVTDREFVWHIFEVLG